MKDEKIKRKVERIARKNGYEIGIKVEDRVVYLDGRVNSWEDFVKIGSLTGKIKNVKGVVLSLIHI